MKHKNSKTIITVITVIAVFALAGYGAWYGYDATHKPVKIVGSLSLGFVEGESASALYIADQLGFFTANGLNVKLQPFATGLEAYNAMMAGEVDVSGPTEYVLVGGILNQDKAQAFATIVDADVLSIIGRKDHGIEGISDLAGKRIALPRKTILEFFLGRFLELHGMSINDVTLVDMSYADSVTALEAGDVDAAVTVSPYCDAILNYFGAGAVEWPAQSNQPLFGNLVSTDDWLAQNPDLAVRLLKAIDQADNYMLQHRDPATAILQNRLNLDAASAAVIWQQNSFSLSLNQALVIAMEDEARWMIANGITGQKSVPDFTDYIYFDGLNKVKPDAVSIIR